MRKAQAESAAPSLDVSRPAGAPVERGLPPGARPMSIRELYQREARSELAELTAQIELLRRRSAKAGRGAVADHEKKLVSLETKTKSIEVRLVALDDTQQGAWEDIQTELRRSMEELANEVAVEALTLHQMLGYEKRQMKDLRLAYLRRASTQLDDLALEIENLIARASGADVRSCQHLQERLEGLRHQGQGYQKRIQTLAESTQATWDELTDEVENLISPLRRALAEAECELNSTMISPTKLKENSTWQKEKPIEKRQTLN